MRNISRRDFLKGTAAAAAALSLTGITTAFADETPAEEKVELVPTSTFDYDAAVIGCGAAGL